MILLLALLTGCDKKEEFPPSGPITIYEAVYACEIPVPKRQGGVLVYNLNDITRERCIDESITLTFDQNFRQVDFQCTMTGENSAFWRCSWPLIPEREYAFEFGPSVEAPLTAFVSQRNLENEKCFTGVEVLIWSSYHGASFRCLGEGGQRPTLFEATFPDDAGSIRVSTPR